MHIIGQLAVVDPGEASKRILGAIRAAKMDHKAAAESLDCGYSTLSRWITKLELRDAIEEMNTEAMEEGWHHGRLGGRPPATKPKDGNRAPSRAKGKAKARKPSKK